MTKSWITGTLTVLTLTLAACQKNDGPYKVHVDPDTINTSTYKTLKTFSKDELGAARAAAGFNCEVLPKSDPRIKAGMSYHFNLGGTNDFIPSSYSGASTITVSEASPEKLVKFHDTHYQGSGKGITYTIKYSHLQTVIYKKDGGIESTKNSDEQVSIDPTPPDDPSSNCKWQTTEYSDSTYEVGEIELPGGLKTKALKTRSVSKFSKKCGENPSVIVTESTENISVGLPDLQGAGMCGATISTLQHSTTSDGQKSHYRNTLAKIQLPEGVSLEDLLPVEKKEEKPVEPSVVTEESETKKPEDTKADEPKKEESSTSSEEAKKSEDNKKSEDPKVTPKKPTKPTKPQSAKPVASKEKPEESKAPAAEPSKLNP
ncbi:MAG: hypothetical protein AB7F59_15435 [Bdellovibrionales bacterium]